MLGNLLWATNPLRIATTTTISTTTLLRRYCSTTNNNDDDVNNNNNNDNSNNNNDNNNNDNSNNNNNSCNNNNSSTKAVNISTSSLRMDRILASSFHMGRRDVELNVLSGCVLLNGVQTLKKGVVIKRGDVLDHLHKDRISEHQVCFSRLRVVEIEENLTRRGNYRLSCLRTKTIVLPKKFYKDSIDEMNVG